MCLKTLNLSDHLQHIDYPDDLRKLSVDQLPEVCAEIREFLIEQLSDNPGHFASSMGAVEITVALHYAFNTPYDKIVWDVGHQAYPHKILTGRRARFAGNRKLGGLSGFPNPDESEYDTFTAGHASNSVSAALGMAVASTLKQDEPPRHVIAVIGDASISGGLAFEGLNNAANTPNDLLIILNDNDMSIDRNVGALHSYLAHLNTSPAYNAFRYKVYKLLRKLHLVREGNKSSILRFNNSLKSLISKQQNIFEGLNIRYFGPFDGHDVKGIIRVLNDIKDLKGPKLLHLRTIKGKGYAPAEEDPASWHAPGKFDPETGRKITSSKQQPPKYQEVFGKTLVELADNDERIVGITAAMPSGTSISELQKAHPDRTFDVGISEGHAVTFAGGLAKAGLKPFVAIYSSFLQRGFDHIIHDVALARLPVVFCIDRAGIVGEDGATHHGMLDLSYMSSIPGMIVSSPSDEMTLRNLMLTAARHCDGPFAIRYPRGSGRNLQWENTMEELPIGKGRKLADGRDVVVLSIGPIASEVSKAIGLLEGTCSAAHYDMIFLKPIDEEILREAVDKNVPIITVEDASIKGGLGSAVATWLSDHNISRTLKRIAVADTFVSQGTVAQLYAQCGLDAASIASAIRECLKNKPFTAKRLNALQPTI